MRQNHMYLVFIFLAKFSNTMTYKDWGMILYRKQLKFIAIILAAGKGTRLRPITYQKPKCLVEVNGKPILRYQLDGFIKAKVDLIIIVIGYLGEKIRRYIETLPKHMRSHILIVENKEYEVTNNMYSLKLALDDILSSSIDFEYAFIINGDVVIEDKLVLHAVRKTSGSKIFVDRSIYTEESMKVTVDNDQRITDISKEIPKERAYGVSIDLYRFSYEDVLKLYDIIEMYIKSNIRDRWTEVAIQYGVQKRLLEIFPEDITGYLWWEIDNQNDLIYASYLFRLSDINYLLIKKDICIFDLDGTIISGFRAIPYAKELIELLISNGKKIVFLTNNTSRTNREHLIHIISILRLPSNLKSDALYIYSALDFLVSFLKKNNIKRIYPLLSSTVVDYLKKEGFVIDSNNPQVIIVGFDTELNYHKLKKASILIQKGIPWILANPDLRCPWGDLYIPDAGSIGLLIKSVTEKEPLLVGGKPRPEMLDYISRKFNTPKDRLIYFGDRIYTDLEMAKNAGIDFCLVLTGETKMEDFIEYAKQVGNLRNLFLCPNWHFLYERIKKLTIKN